MTDLVSYSLDGQVATITMDDGKANAMSHAMMDAVFEALDRAEKEAQVVVLKGRPGVFCAGFDLKVMQGPLEGMVSLVQKGAAYLERLFLYPRPLVIVNTGHAMAGGALALLTGDHRIAVEGDFKIGLNETAIGMALPTFGIELARERLPACELTRATACATLYSPHEAARSGYADESVSPENLQTAIDRTTERLLELNTKAFAVTKKRLRKDAVERMRTAGEDELKAIF